MKAETVDTIERCSLRPMDEADLEFLRALYASTRQEELSVVAWTDEQKSEFLRMQFEAQHVHYQQSFPDAEFLVIELEGERVGRLYVDRRDDEIRIVDIALVPAHRKRGIGSAYLRRVLSEAESTDKVVRIHVERYNPAFGLYQRLGFREIDTNGVYYLMEWAPNGHGESTSNHQTG